VKLKYDPEALGDTYLFPVQAKDKLPCAFCGRAFESEALIAIPSPPGRAKLACGLCVAMSRNPQRTSPREA
jgi:hypothetical protein